MPYQRSWLVEKRVALTRFYGNLTLEDVERFIVEQKEAVEIGIPLVHHISDGREIEKIELKLRTFQLLLNGIQPSERFGWQVEVTVNPMNRMISSIVGQFAGVNMRVEPTVEAAVVFLKRMDLSLSQEVFALPSR